MSFQEKYIDLKPRQMGGMETDGGGSSMQVQDIAAVLYSFDENTAFRMSDSLRARLNIRDDVGKIFQVTHIHTNTIFFINIPNTFWEGTIEIGEKIIKLGKANATIDNEEIIVIKKSSSSMSAKAGSHSNSNSSGARTSSMGGIAMGINSTDDNFNSSEDETAMGIDGTDRNFYSSVGEIASSMSAKAGSHSNSDGAGHFRPFVAMVRDKNNNNNSNSSNNNSNSSSASLVGPSYNFSIESLYNKQNCEMLQVIDGSHDALVGKRGDEIRRGATFIVIESDSVFKTRTRSFLGTDSDGKPRSYLDAYLEKGLDYLKQYGEFDDLGEILAPMVRSPDRGMPDLIHAVLTKTTEAHIGRRLKLVSGYLDDYCTCLFSLFSDPEIISMCSHNFLSELNLKIKQYTETQEVTGSLYDLCIDRRWIQIVMHNKNKDKEDLTQRKFKRHGELAVIKGLFEIINPTIDSNNSANDSYLINSFYTMFQKIKEIFKDNLFAMLMSQLVFDAVWGDKDIVTLTETEKQVIGKYINMKGGVDGCTSRRHSTDIQFKGFPKPIPVKASILTQISFIDARVFFEDRGDDIVSTFEYVYMGSSVSLRNICYKAETLFTNGKDITLEIIKSIRELIDNHIYKKFKKEIEDEIKDEIKSCKTKIKAKIGREIRYFVDDSLDTFISDMVTLGFSNFLKEIRNKNIDLTEENITEIITIALELFEEINYIILLLSAFGPKGIGDPSYTDIAKYYQAVAITGDHHYTLNLICEWKEKHVQTIFGDEVIGLSWDVERLNPAAEVFKNSNTELQRSLTQNSQNSPGGGGGSDTDRKYFKYKAKYLQLKNNLIARKL